MKAAVPLVKAYETSFYGAKAIGLGEAARKGIPIPPGVALSADLVEAIASRDKEAIHGLWEAVADLPSPFAVRSSAIDEDGGSASFAGQHLTKLNVSSTAELWDSICEVWWSANSDSAITYRQRVGMFTRPSVGVVVQTLLNPSVAGVMFTQNPITGADEFLIEASYGLGEAVVAGLVIPDQFRLDRSGLALECKIGHKQIAIRSFPSGGTYEEAMSAAQMEQPCLNDSELKALGELALICEKVYGPGRDIEWAIQEGKLYLLQSRPITTVKNLNDVAAPSASAPPPRDPVAALLHVPLFSDMDRKQVEQIVRLLKARLFKKGETIIMEGSGGSAFFLIDSGEATVTCKGVQIATFGPGDFFGELSLIDSEPRSATVTATSDLHCYGLTFWEFRPLLDKNPSIAWKILQALTKRLRVAINPP